MANRGFIITFSIFLIIFLLGLFNYLSSFPLTSLQNEIPDISICDTFKIDRPMRRNYKKDLDFWLKEMTLNEFFIKEQENWRRAKVWAEQVVQIDTNFILKCVSNQNHTLMLYIPHQYYIKTTNGNRFYRFYIINNSEDTVTLSRADDTILNIHSYIAFKNTPNKWLPFQTFEEYITCGNSDWTMNLPPRVAVEAQIETYYLNFGDSIVNYRLG